MKRLLCVPIAILLMLCVFSSPSFAETNQIRFTERQEVGVYSFCTPSGWKSYPDDGGKRFDYYCYDESGNLSAALIVLLTPFDTSLYASDKEAKEQIDKLMLSSDVSDYTYGKVDECPASFWGRKQDFAGIDDVYVTVSSIINRFSALTVMYSHFNNDDSSLANEFSELISTFSAKQDLIQYFSGMYKVGSDIEAGEYLILNSSSTNDAYFGLYADSNGDKIIANDNFAFNSIITVKKGEYLKVTRGTFCLLDDFDSRYKLNTSSSGAMFKVGVHIEPGEYKLKADDSGKGYYCIYKSSRQDKIVANDNFSGQSYVTVKKGQYLVLNRCTIVK